VVEALGHGEQILIFRKGGLDEGPGGFAICHSRFWLFPTQFHQQTVRIVPSWMKQLQQRIQPASAPGLIPIEFACEVVGHHQLEHPDQIQALQGQHVWQNEVLEERMVYGTTHRLHALLVQVHRLTGPTPIPMSDAYEGCRSWVELEEAPEWASTSPVLNTQDFEAKKNAFHRALS